jgi:hypothetical protein
MQTTGFAQARILSRIVSGDHIFRRSHNPGDKMRREKAFSHLFGEGFAEVGVSLTVNITFGPKE